VCEFLFWKGSKQHLQTPEQKYSHLKEKYQKLIAEQTDTINLISTSRLIVFLIGAGLGIYFLVKKNYGLFAFDLGLFLAIFIALMVVHESYFKKKKHSMTLSQINQDSLKRIHGEWNTFSDDGREFIDENHPYSQDLDIFGQGSLFQFINTARTYLGRFKLRDLLITPPKSIEEIGNRQEAIRELTQKLGFRQKYMAEGMQVSKMHDPKELFSWANRVESFYRKPLVIIIFRLMPVITIVVGFFTFFNPETKYYALIVLLLIQFVILRINAGKRGKILGVAAHYMDNIRAYSRMLNLLELETYNSPYLEGLKTKLKDKNEKTACEQIRKLVSIVDSISNKSNFFYIVLNIIFLMDYEYMFFLEKWKEQSGTKIKNWLYTIAEFEALASLAVLRYDYPEWAMPELTEGLGSDNSMPLFVAEKMGHPLLVKSSVANDLKFEFPKNILLITGSNMSGKSTLLRTAGINLVLAYAGTAVCANTFKCSLMDIYTCMRVNDNLEKNISAFYAELLRIKMIVEAVEKGKTIFFLLDEIFKGTNSMDRHTGGKVLIKKLSKKKILGLISTHDLELAELEKEGNMIKNYHFQEYYVNGKICFDYKLRNGVSTTRNAAFLMKMAGIDI